jgi:hypothetical protein
MRRKGSGDGRGTTQGRRSWRELGRVWKGLDKMDRIPGREVWRLMRPRVEGG